MKTEVKVVYWTSIVVGTIGILALFWPVILLLIALFENANHEIVNWLTR